MKKYAFCKYAFKILPSDRRYLCRKKSYCPDKEVMSGSLDESEVLTVQFCHKKMKNNKSLENRVKKK